VKRSGRQTATRRTGISRAKTYTEIGEFWDVRDLADVRPVPRRVSFSVTPGRRRFLVALDPALVEQLRDEALRRGLSSESLLNLWVKEELTG
jgi:hypothetical protein